MDIWSLIMEIVMLLGLAFLLGVVAQRLNQSAIIGYLLAGAILGPLMFNKGAVHDIAELGVALLLFSIGLEFSLSRLKEIGARAFMTGALQVLLTLTVFTLVFAFRGPIREALALGAIIALSSTAIVLRVLVDRTAIDSLHGRNALAILLTQDAAVVPLVLLVTVLGHGGDMSGVVLHIARTLGAAAGLAALFYLLFYIVIPKALMTKGLFANRELVVLLANDLSAAVIELNPKTAAVACEKGLSVHMADATSSETIDHIGLKGACLVIVTVPDPQAAREIINNIRIFSPKSMIIARSRYHIAKPSLQKAGATIVVDEERTVGDTLALKIIETLGKQNRNALGCALAGEKP